MRIDRSDPADEPDDVHTADRGRSAIDNLDATGKDKGIAVDGDGSPDSLPARPDSTLRTERTMAYRAAVDAAYRQYAIDRSDARAETLERETATPAVSRTDVENPGRYRAGLADRLKDKGQPAEAARRSPQATDDTNAITRDGAPGSDSRSQQRRATSEDSRMR